MIYLGYIFKCDIFLYWYFDALGTHMSLNIQRKMDVWAGFCNEGMKWGVFWLDYTVIFSGASLLEVGVKRELVYIILGYVNKVTGTTFLREVNQTHLWARNPYGVPYAFALTRGGATRSLWNTWTRRGSRVFHSTSEDSQTLGVGRQWMVDPCPEGQRKRFILGWGGVVIRGESSVGQ